MPVVAPMGVVLGFSMPEIFIHLRPFVPWIFGIITLSGALKLRVAEFGSTIRSPAPIAVFFVTSHVLMPLCAMFTATIFFNDSPDTVTGYILLFSGPTAISSFIWVTMFQGNKALCLTLILLGTMSAPLLVPLTVSLLMGAKVAMDAGGIAISLVMMVVIPTIIGVTLNETTRGTVPNLLCPYLNPIAKICLTLVIAANTSPIAKIIRFDDPIIWKIAALCTALSAGGFLLSKAGAGIIKSNTDKSITLFYAGGLRNISSVTTIAVTFFPEATAIPALLGIVFQQTISAIMGKLCFPKAR